MGKYIDNTAQLDTFDTIKSILRGSSILKRKFRDSDYYEYEPSLQSLSFKQVPYIVIKTPITSQDDKTTTNNKINLKQFDVDLIVVIDYQARTKFRTYANEILQLIEASTATLNANGFYDVRITLDSTTHEVIERKDVVTGNFSITMQGFVGR